MHTRDLSREYAERWSFKQKFNQASERWRKSVASYQEKSNWTWQLPSGQKLAKRSFANSLLCHLLLSFFCKSQKSSSTYGLKSLEIRTYIHSPRLRILNHFFNSNKKEFYEREIKFDVVSKTVWLRSRSHEMKRQVISFEKKLASSCH